MASIFNLTKDKIPFWQGGNGMLTVNVGAASLGQPLTPSDGDLASIGFGVAGDNQFTFGSPDNFKLGVEAGVSASLMPLWASSNETRRSILAKYGLADFFDDHPDKLILALVLGAGASASAAGSFKYSALTASATLDVGGQAGYAYLHPFPANQPVEQMLGEFFKSLSLPTGVTAPPKQGEVIAFEYGGYLKVGASLSVGYEMKGTASTEKLGIGEINLAEHYRLSVIGKLGLSAGVAGYFSVEVRTATDEKGDVMPDWARVIVRKKRAKELSIAADVNISASAEPETLPDSGKEFLGAMLGVNVKNWLNAMEQINQFTDVDQLKKELDGLAKRFIGEWLDKSFDQLSETDFPALSEKVQKVVDSYRNLDNSAITLFDRYFNRLDLLTARLGELAVLPSWDQLQGKLDGELGDIVRQLTDGEPLGWILGEVKLPDTGGAGLDTLAVFRERALATLDLIGKDAHAEIRKVIKLAKEGFPLEGFLKQLEGVDKDKLKALANQKAGFFVERLIGSAINDDVKAASKKVQGALKFIDEFEKTLYGKFKQGLIQSFSLDLHAGYSRASERDALIDVMIKLQDGEGVPNPPGISLMQAAGRGDFQDVLAAYQPDVVRINSGILSHSTRRQSSFSINIAGWHKGFRYQGFDRVITHAEQQIEAEDKGLSIFTTIDMEKRKERQRNNERMYTNFLLRFIGHSIGAVEFDRKNQQYLIETITRMAARYELGFDDERTRPQELKHYLSFAQDFGLAEAGATFEQLQPLLPTKAGDPNDFGRVKADYEVRYTESGLRRLLTASFDEQSVRTIMRKIVLANYLPKDNLRDAGWAYWTQAVYNTWKIEPQSFVLPIGSGNRQIKPIQTSPFAEIPTPDRAILSPERMLYLRKLFSFEDNLVSGLKRMIELVQSDLISAADFEDALGDFGSALKDFDDIDEGTNTVFAVFDQLIRLHTPASQARGSSLTLVSNVGAEDEPITKMFIAQPTSQ